VEVSIANTGGFAFTLTSMKGFVQSTTATTL